MEPEKQQVLAENDQPNQRIFNDTAFGSPPFQLFFKKWKIDNREKLADWYRNYYHTVVCSLLIIFNLILSISGVILYSSHWKHKVGDPDVFLSLMFDHPPRWLSGLLHLMYAPIDQWGYWWWAGIVLLPWLTWAYSTITRPIRKGYKDIINMKSRKGRIRVVILCAIPFAIQFCAFFAWYVDVEFYPGLSQIHVDKDFLVVKSMESFAYVLMLTPIFMCVIGLFQVLKQVFMYEDLRKMFFSWEFSLFARFSNPLKIDRCDVVVGWETKTKKPVVLPERSRYLHELISGTTGSGKTSTTILIRIVQDLIRIARGHKTSIVLLEPKGDAIRDVLKLAKKLGIPDEKILVVDPTDLVRSIKFNPFAGPLEAASENFRGVLDSLAGDQDEFFKGQQGETAAAYTRLGKIRFGNMFTMMQMRKMYIDPRYLADITEHVRAWINENLKKPDVTAEDRKKLEGFDQVCQYFEKEVLDYKTYKDKEGAMVPSLYGENHEHAGKQVVESKKDKFVTGAKKYLNEITMNAMLSELMVPTNGEKSLDIDEFLDKGEGILLVNTALGELDELSLLLGQFFIRQFQASVFRRPPEENGYKRSPVFFYIDEFPLYANPSFERMLTLGRSYKVGSLIAIQSLGQLERVEQGYDKVIWSNARTKTCFGGGTYDDNKRFSDQFGEEYFMEESMNESTTPITMPNQTWGYRLNTQRTLQLRFTPTDIQEFPFKHFIIQMVDEDNNPLPPISAFGKFVNETMYLKKFLDIGNIELETKKHRDIKAQRELYSSLVGKSLYEKGIPLEEINAAIAKQSAETKQQEEEENVNQPDPAQSGSDTTQGVEEKVDPQTNKNSTEGNGHTDDAENKDAVNTQDDDTPNEDQNNDSYEQHEDTSDLEHNGVQSNSEETSNQNVNDKPLSPIDESNAEKDKVNPANDVKQDEINQSTQESLQQRSTKQTDKYPDGLNNLRNDVLFKRNRKPQADPSQQQHSIPSPQQNKAIEDVLAQIDNTETNSSKEPVAVGSEDQSTASTKQKQYAQQAVKKNLRGYVDDI
jgi:hypothetical protein